MKTRFASKLAIRFIAHSNAFRSISIFSFLNALKVFDINKLQTAAFFYQYNIRLISNCFENLITDRANLHTYSHERHYRGCGRAGVLHLQKFSVSSVGKILL